MTTLSYRRSMAGIALVAMTTLMFELLVNKALAFSTWGGLGYMIIGSAIFGYSIAGVVIAIWKPHEKYSLGVLLSYATLAWSVSMVLCYIVMNEVPFGFGKLYREPLSNIFYFTIWYLTLLIPFSLSGFIVASLLTVFKERSNRLYAADLVGAGLGCLIVVPMFPPLGAGGIYMVCALLAAVCAIIFSAGIVRWVTVGAALLAVLFAVLAPSAESVYAVRSHDIKRERGEQFAAGYIKTSLWSFLSKIEVAIVPDVDRSMLWFDGGVMQSNIDKFNGDYAAQKDKKQVNGPNSLVYRIRPRANSLIIAPAGGREVRAALTWGAGRITGVELDPSVVELVQTKINDHLGGIFRNPRVTTVNDEGRSFVRRSKEHYDSIQCISAYSVEAAQSGAVDNMSAYLVTLDAIDDYLDHLTEDGALSLSYGRSLRLFYTMWEALERRGLDPSQRIIMLHNDHSTLTWNTVLVKLEPFTPEEMEVVRGVALDRLPINYAPAAMMADVDHVAGLTSEPKTRRLIEEFIATPKERRSDFYAAFPYNVKPVTDDKPFYEAWRYIGAVEASKPELLAEEFEDLISKREFIPRFPLNQAAQMFILVEAGIFALLFLIFPLWKFKSDGIQTRPQKLSMLYFLSLGLGFIWIEVVFLKSFVLFLGSPVYSIAVVLFAMLIFAGLGSFYSERLRGTVAQKTVKIGIGLVVIGLAAAFIYPSIQQFFLGLPLLGRMLVAVAMLAPVGFVMGMPFPTGLQLMAKSSPESIPWAWAMNGYGTVVGISSASLITIATGFKVMIVLSLIVYLLGFVALRAGARLFSASGAEPAFAAQAPGVA